MVISRVSKLARGLRGRGHRGARAHAQARLDERGGALLEFTILAPVFFLIVFGIIEWGLLYQLQNSMTNAAREAARSIAVQNLSATQARTIAQNYLAGNGITFDSSNIVITDHCSSTPKVPQITVTITADAAAASVINFLNMFTGGTLTAVASMRKELACP